jgi:hypothetical protein
MSTTHMRCGRYGARGFDGIARAVLQLAGSVHVYYDGVPQHMLLMIVTEPVQRAEQLTAFSSLSCWHLASVAAVLSSNSTVARPMLCGQPCCFAAAARYESPLSVCLNDKHWYGGIDKSLSACACCCSAFTPVLQQYTGSDRPRNRCAKHTAAERP